ncbi:MAG: HEAT repeat domain-containing protein [Xenococcus sp. (in: cyanobacteria)]
MLFLLNAVKTLIETLELNDSEVRIEIIWALGEIRDCRAIEAISQFVEDKDSIIRETAQAALLKLQ